MPPPLTLTFDLVTLKVVSESRVTWATSVPNLVFLGLSVLDLGPMYATADRGQTDICQTRIIASCPLPVLPYLFYGVMDGLFLNYMFLSLIILDVQE